MRAFLEKVEKDYLDDFVFISKYQLQNLGVEIIDIDGNNLKSIEKYNPNLKSDIIIGSVEASCAFFNACGVDVPKYLGYPEELRKYLGREIIETKFGEINHPYPFFIKPSTHVKLFTGTLVENEKSHKFMRDFYKEIQSDTELFLSTPINFISEYRCFVHKGELMGIQWYSGAFRLFPNIQVIESMIKDYKSANISYTFDVGITDDGNTKLVEVNDMWAIGSYGFNGKDYVRMTIDRFQEIYKNSVVLNV
jgi:hypothetical protein